MRFSLGGVHAGGSEGVAAGSSGQKRGSGHETSESRWCWGARKVQATVADGVRGPLLHIADRSRRGLAGLIEAVSETILMIPADRGPPADLPLGVTGNTPDSGSGESWFDPRRGNSS